MSRRVEEQRYEGLSPFELKNKLAAMAGSRHERMMLNAGRGNPNWVATASRDAFFLLGEFALAEARRILDRSGLGGAPDSRGVTDRLSELLQRTGDREGAALLAAATDYATTTLGLDGDSFVGELVDGVLGDHYPTPDRMLKNIERVVQAYLELTMFGDESMNGTMDLFAVEGGTAAMTYVFNTLKENGLLVPGDRLALGCPIFTPYLEIPPLDDYQLEIVEIQQDENQDWQYPDTELAKLDDPSIKAFFLVNPSNPSSVSVASDSLRKIADLVRNRRKDLIILTDDVYGTFVDDFQSLAAIAPKNTILVYSFSKYFGATGWRLGVIGMRRDNVLDEMIAAFPETERLRLRRRYESITTDPDHLRLIDRMVADSRAVALNHTAGLSTPQQVMMALFSLQELVDADGVYRKDCRAVIRDRYETLYDALGVDAPELPRHACYYTTIDVPLLATDRYGAAFAEWLKREHEPIDFVWRLAEEKEIVLMDGGGFDAPRMSVRVSLANLPKKSYAEIGRGISSLLEDYHKQWKRMGNNHP